MSQSSIEWTDETWNPVTGCDRVSPGCDHCYALDLAARLKRMGQPRYQNDGKPPTSGPGFGVTLHEDKIGEPVHWRKPRMVFVNSMSDLFHPKVPGHFIRRCFDVMADCPEHTFQVLTKRPKRMRAWVANEIESGWDRNWPWPNIWLGTSIESAAYVGRADELRQTPAAVRFISAEPLLGNLDPRTPDDEAEGTGGLSLRGIDWLIVGGESGPMHRPVQSAWVRNLRDAATLTGTAFFFKQWGGRTPKAGGRELDGRTWDEFPSPFFRAEERDG